METQNPIVSSKYYRDRVSGLQNLLGHIEEEIMNTNGDDNRSLWRLGVLDDRRMNLMVSIEKLKREEGNRNSLLDEMAELFEKIVDKPKRSEYGNDSEEYY